MKKASSTLNKEEVNLFTIPLVKISSAIYMKMVYIPDVSIAMKPLEFKKK